MKSLRAVPLLLPGAVLLACALPAAAQHPGGGRAFTPVPAGAAPHSGFAPPAHGAAFSASPTRIGAPAGLQIVPGRANAARSPGNLFPPPGVTSTRPVYFSNGIARYGQPSHRGEHERGDRNGSRIVSFGYPGYLAFGYDPEFLDATENPNTVSAGYTAAPPPDALSGAQPYPQTGTGQAAEDRSSNAEPEPDSQPSYLAPGRGRSQAPAAATAPLPEEDTVIILFKDGRPPEQIHNYALTPTALYVTAGRVRTIPIDQIDMAATEKINEKAGVDFHLPTR